jgi:predicted SnoaL-like aldol condensation-catalyzing enzyme
MTMRDSGSPGPAGPDPKQQVVALLESIETGASEPVSVITPGKYVQHNLGVEDGLDGFGKLLAQLPKGSARVNTVRVFRDGDVVIAHSDYDLFGPKAGFDVFRFEGGKIVEHWDNLQENPGTPNPSGRTMLDGTTTVSDLEKTDENKRLVRRFFEEIMMRGEMQHLASYFDGTATSSTRPGSRTGSRDSRPTCSRWRRPASRSGSTASTRCLARATSCSS